MSFFQKLISFRPDRKQRAQEQIPADINKHLCTREEDGFVFIYPVLSDTSSGGAGNKEDESADVSKWEMAEILNPRNKSVVPKYDGNNKTQKSTLVLERLRHRYKYRPDSLFSGVATVTEDPRQCMEDSDELEMFNDRRNAKLKSCRRRKYLSYNSKQ